MLKQIMTSLKLAFLFRGAYRGKMGTRSCLLDLLGWENGIYCIGSGIQPLGMGLRMSKTGKGFYRSLTVFLTPLLN